MGKTARHTSGKKLGFHAKRATSRFAESAESVRWTTGMERFEVSGG
jgi:hypothetical protein